ncbi:prolipoprotein diacylglyceryl transferase Lgt [Gottschalkia purinilytica]|uniref:Prolipoprotein diacylglyceryl transferase Lgt n=1 Tax=Gottschalkia purinilytica TaxID=1503 RepID=A0A0L0W837_GOTPU|nr:prolipoprotein diacylglyceryl transferase family protein [Gottschalkia purinilytica]KNF07606.1 prolipoprotein diacylglyceryl transferase Lgt [Gottschalkia purinilytica]
MRPFFLAYKSITITWFMILAIISIVISYFIVNILAEEYEEDKNKIENIFIVLLIGGFVGARLSYVLMNIHLYKGNISSIFKISHYNLSLIGGIIFGLLVLMVLSKKYKIAFGKLLKIFVIPFYFSMAIGIWVLMFDRFLLYSSHIKNEPSKVLYLSLLFLTGMILELAISKRVNNKYITVIILTIVMVLYYIM